MYRKNVRRGSEVVQCCYVHELKKLQIFRIYGRTREYISVVISKIYFLRRLPTHYFCFIFLCTIQLNHKVIMIISDNHKLTAIVFRSFRRALDSWCKSRLRHIYSVHVSFSLGRKVTVVTHLPACCHLNHFYER